METKELGKMLGFDVLRREYERAKMAKEAIVAYECIVDVFEDSATDVDYYESLKKDLEKSDWIFYDVAKNLESSMEKYIEEEEERDKKMGT